MSQTQSSTHASAVVAFVDLAGFSAIPDVYGDEAAIAVLEIFLSSDAVHLASAADRENDRLAIDSMYAASAKSDEKNDVFRTAVAFLMGRLDDAPAPHRRPMNTKEEVMVHSYVSSRMRFS